VIVWDKPGATLLGYVGGVAYVLDEDGGSSSVATCPWWLEPVPAERMPARRRGGGAVVVHSTISTRPRARVGEQIGKHLLHTAATSTSDAGKLAGLSAEFVR